MVVSAKQLQLWYVDDVDVLQYSSKFKFKGYFFLRSKLELFPHYFFKYLICNTASNKFN